MIKSLRIRNFKSFVDETIEFSALTIVIGGNGAGKSNLFDALRFLRSIGEGRSVRDAVEGHALPGASSPIVSGIRGGGGAATHFLSETAIFELDVTALVRGQTIRYFVAIDAHRHRVVQEELASDKHPGTYVFSTKPETGPLEQRGDSPALAARFHKSSRGLNPKRDFSPTEFLLSQFTSRRAESRLNEDVADLIRAELASIAPLELQPDVLRRYSPLGRFEMGEHGENFAAAVWKLNEDADDLFDFSTNDDGDVKAIYDHEARARRSAVLAWLSQVTPRAIASLSTQSSPTSEVIVAVTEEPYEQPIAAPSLSDGTLRFAALALAAVGQTGRRTLVIEELENGINPARIALLIKMFEQVAEANQTVQVIASTHSSAILDFAGKSTVDCAVVIGWDEDHLTSRVVPVRDLPGLSKALDGLSLGDLQEEGWLQLAAGAK